MSTICNSKFIYPKSFPYFWVISKSISWPDCKIYGIVRTAYWLNFTAPTALHLCLLNLNKTLKSRRGTNKYLVFEWTINFSRRDREPTLQCVYNQGQCICNKFSFHIQATLVRQCCLLKKKVYQIVKQIRRTVIFTSKKRRVWPRVT